MAETEVTPVGEGAEVCTPTRQLPRGAAGCEQPAHMWEEQFHGSKEALQPPGHGGLPGTTGSMPRAAAKNISHGSKALLLPL